jgi:hypothetical protein
MATKVPDRIRGLERVGRALTERNEELVAEMVQRIREEVPAYSKVDPSVFERIRELAGPTALAISAGLIEHTPVRRGDIPTIKEQAADRLRTGIDLDSCLYAYRAALFLYWDVAMEEATRLHLSRIAALASADSSWIRSTPSPHMPPRPTCARTTAFGRRPDARSPT